VQLNTEGTFFEKPKSLQYWKREAAQLLPPSEYVEYVKQCRLLASLDMPKCVSPKLHLPLGGLNPQANSWFLGQNRVHTPNITSIGSVVVVVVVVVVYIATPLRELTCHKGSQCYLPPSRWDISTFTPAETGTRFNDQRDACLGDKFRPTEINVDARDGCVMVFLC